MLLFILQNAYKSEKHFFRNENEWSKELSKSHTGRRLQEMIPDGIIYKVINSTDIIGNNPNSCYPANLDYIQKYIDEIQPDVICACGNIAKKACGKLNIAFISAPHPAWRRLSKNHTDAIKKEIKEKLEKNENREYCFQKIF